MMYLIRHLEHGKEPHPEKSKARHDILDSIAQKLPGARVSLEIGRIFVETDLDARDALASVHGISSFSPCERCSLDDLEARVVAMARGLLAEGQSFAMRVKRVGEHGFSSQQAARDLGALICREIPQARVDLASPAVSLGVEIRGPWCYLYHEVIEGLDEREHGRRQRYADVRFVVDHMLGTLASRLRLLGFDTTYYRDTADSFLLRKSDEEQRILLTQDRGLFRLGGAASYFVQARLLDDQVKEVLDAFHLQVDEASVLSRCSACNAPVTPADKASIEGKVPDGVFAQYDTFFRCVPCDKVYWKGTHHERMKLV